MRGIRIERPRGPRVHYAPILIAGVVLVALLVFGKMATSRFQWWKEAAFEGRVVGKQAILSASGSPIDPDAALEDPSRCRFFLKVRRNVTTSVHEVIPLVFRDARVGDVVIKRGGTYKFRVVAAEPGPPGP